VTAGRSVRGTHRPRSAEAAVALAGAALAASVAGEAVGEAAAALERVARPAAALTGIEAEGAVRLACATAEVVVAGTAAALGGVHAALAVGRAATLDPALLLGLIDADAVPPLLAAEGI